jgi:4'-phosphopantetheinyl transferase EntD
VLEDDPASARGLVAAVLGPHAIGVEAGPGDWEAPLLPEEEPMVARAIDRRRREVAAGRSCARRALTLLGAAPVALPAGPDRVPRWPDGVVGTITHTRDFCAAAVAWQRDLRGLGLDAERAIASSREEVMRLVATPAEARWLAHLDGGQRPLGSALIFSAKEALYKCQYPLTRQMLDFADVELALEPGQAAGAAGQLVAAFRAGTLAADLPRLTAHYAIDGDLVVTAAFLAP